MRKWILYYLKRLLCAKELDALERYRQAAYQAKCWNGEMPQSAQTAQWINDVGEGKRGMDIPQMRDDLRAGRDPALRVPASN